VWIKAIPKTELARVLPRLDVGLMILKNVPAFYFGTSPNKFFDYIACGIPVLNNYPGWLAGLIEEHRCGLAIPPDDPKAFADAVLKLHDDPAGRKKMGENGCRLAKTQFSRDILGRKFVEVLESVYRRGRKT
jgi:glycosyltransferase involved in cell wall biosynthesis